MYERYITEDDLNIEWKKFQVFRILFENGCNNLDFSLKNRELNKLVRKAKLYRTINDIILEESFLVADVKENYYYELLNKTKKLADELNLSNSLELSILYSYLLWNGYFSKTKINNFSSIGRSNMWGMFAADIMDGIGVCLNHADMLKDFLIYCGYDSAVLMNYVKFNSLIYDKINIERNYENQGVGTKISRFSLDRMLSIITGNHAFTLIKDNDGSYIFDSTNLAMYEIINPYSAKIINGRGNSIIKPYLSCALTTVTKNELDAIENIFCSEIIKTPYNLDDFTRISEQKVEIFNNNLSLLDDFYIDIKPNIDSISESISNIKIKRRR